MIGGEKMRKRGMFTIILLTISLVMTGCNRNAGADAGEAAEADTGTQQAPENNTISVSGTAGNGRVINFIRSPYEITDDSQTGESVTPDPAYSSPQFDPADPDEAPPQFFDVEDPLEPIMGYCDNDMCDQLIKELNARRTNFGVGTLSKNYSMCVAADVRAREYAVYPVYKQRPDGRSFESVSPQGYIKNEYFIIPSRNSVTPKWDSSKGTWTNPSPTYAEYTYTPNLVVEGLMEIREARNILLNDDYKQVGASWFVTGSYFIAGFTLSY